MNGPVNVLPVLKNMAVACHPLPEIHAPFPPPFASVNHPGTMMYKSKEFSERYSQAEGSCVVSTINNHIF